MTNKLKKIVTFKVTKEEYALLKEKCTDAEMNHSQFLRRCITDTKVYVIPIASELCSTMAYVYDALNRCTPDAISKAIERMDALCEQCVSAERKYEATGQLAQR